MVTINLDDCKKCGVCIERFKNYCISSRDGNPAIDYSLCNECQKCIAICPHQAIFMNGQKPEKINEPLNITSSDLRELLARRRSIKKFKDTPIPKELMLDIADIANYAPNQNKNIHIVLIDDNEMIEQINDSALRYVRRLYRLLFSIKPVTYFCQLFSKSLDVIKKKMEYELFFNKRIIKENTKGMIILVGNPKVPVTESSAQYLLATMIIYAETLGVGTCLMDSFKISINGNKPIKKKMGIPKGYKVFGVLALGYPNEKIINKPQGYKMDVCWNKFGSGIV